jgi:hypothetical protein
MIKEIFKADPMSFVGILISGSGFVFALNEGVWPVAVVFGIALGGLAFGLYRTYTKLK